MNSNLTTMRHVQSHVKFHAKITFFVLTTNFTQLYLLLHSYSVTQLNVVNYSAFTSMHERSKGGG